MNQLLAARDGIAPYFDLPNQTSWSNIKNAPFYESIPIDNIKHFAQLAGLDNGCDIKIIIPFIKSGDKILEVGAGYGRVIEHISKYNLSGEIVALERSFQFYQYLQYNFSNRAEIIHTDINNFSTHEKFDLILWLWEGIADFSRTEQPHILKHISSLLSEKGILVIDTLSSRLNTVNGEKFQTDNTNCKIQLKNWVMNIYRITPNELHFHAQSIGIENISTIFYQTSTNRERVLYILKNH